MEDLSAAKKGLQGRGHGDAHRSAATGKEITTQLTFDAQPQTTGTTPTATASQTAADSNYNNGNNGSGGYGYSDLYDYFFGRH